MFLRKEIIRLFGRKRECINGTHSKRRRVLSHSTNVPDECNSDARVKSFVGGGIPAAILICPLVRPFRGAFRGFSCAP